MHKSTWFFIISFLVISSHVCAQTDKRKQHYNISTTAVAIGGYDPVSYFSKEGPVKGRRELAAVYEGIVYYFETPQNKKQFLESPGKYEPQYGGWCAYAMGAEAEKVEVDPETYTILDGKLYLFYNKYFTNTLKSWKKDELNLKRKADDNWKRLFK